MSSEDSKKDEVAKKADEVEKDVDALATDIAKLDVAEETDPTLQAGDLIVREAGKDSGTDVAPATSFASLAVRQEIKDAVAKKGWQAMSKIQQIGLPLFLHKPPSNLLAQAQAGTGKTGTFVLGLLGRLDAKLLAADKMTRLNRPQGIIVATTQELVTQIAMVVNEFGQGLGVHARRVMSAGMNPDGGAGRGGGRGGRGRGGATTRGGGVTTSASAPKAAAEWAMSEGQDFEEQVLVGTVGKLKNYLQNFRNGRKPYIDASDLCVLVLDEADELLKTDDIFDVRNMIQQRRGDKPLQIALFSATFKESILDRAREFVGNDKKRYHEITLRKEDLTLDKVDNFFTLVGKQGDSPDKIDQLKFQAVLDIWKSLADTSLMGQTVIFVNQKSRAQPLAEFLRSHHYDVGQIHGDMEKVERETVFQEFKDNKRPALVATNLLSRGIDNPNVTLVINVDLPVEKMNSQAGDAETFIHRIGRSGRWTKRGASVSLVSAYDKPIMADIERRLFANESVDRPLILVQDPSMIGEAFNRRVEERKKKAAAPS